MGIGYNIRNNYWETLFQQGLSMLGINNTFGSYSSFDPMSMNESLFNYNVNYDAMAFCKVTNAVLGVTGQAIFSSRAEKQKEKQGYESNKAGLEQIDKEISDDLDTLMFSRTSKIGNKEISICPNVLSSHYCYSSIVSNSDVCGIVVIFDDDITNSDFELCKFVSKFIAKYLEE